MSGCHIRRAEFAVVACFRRATLRVCTTLRHPWLRVRPPLAGLLAVLLLLLAPLWAVAKDKDGDGIADAKDKCPDQLEDFDGDQDEDGCPDDRDSDGDGILDSKDLCPTLPEDKDGALDTDGCPDLKDDKDEDSVPDAQDECPYEPEDHDNFQDLDGCPDPDNDSDGMADSFDTCPLAAEDLDGFADDDGCPDADNDVDGIYDVDDQCPLEPEDFDGHQDEDGCPDVLIIITDQKIELKEKIHFAFDDVTILPDSHELLNDVGNALIEHPTMKVRIEGNTDAEGPADYNQKLSQGRASSVLTYLTGRGVEASRMSAVGYGEDRPIDSNDSEEGRAANRRVEFIIVEQ